MRMPDREALKPRFFIIGAAKAATTWLQVQLQQNSALYLPDPEPHFFSREYEKGFDFYRSFFSECAQTGVTPGEKSADYLAHPGAAQRLARFAPDARIIVQLRDPVVRAYSDFKMFYRRGLVGDRPEEFLSSLDNPYPRFLSDGLYYQHLRRWLDHFSGEQILTLMHEDVLENPGKVLERVARHIGVECSWNGHAAQVFENDSRSKVLPKDLRDALAPLKPAVRPWRTNPLFKTVRSMFARQVRYPPLSPELAERMRDFYHQDTSSLQDLIHRDLGAWIRQEKRLRA